MGPGTADGLGRDTACGPIWCPSSSAPKRWPRRWPRECRWRPAVPLARASRGRDVLAKQLTAAGAAVEQIVVYTSTDVEQPEPDIAAMLRAGRIDWVTVTSSAIARSLGRLFGDELRRARLASISPLTSGVLRELGYQPAAEAAEYTLAGLRRAPCGGHRVGRNLQLHPDGQ